MSENAFPMLFVRPAYRLLVDFLLVFSTLIAIAVPFAHEAFSSDMPEGVPPVVVTHIFVMAKLIAAIGVLVALFSIVLRGRGGGLCRRLATLPLVRTALLAGAVIAVGLTSFDVCTAYHGAGSPDGGGGCFCWLTGALAAAGAFLAGVVCLTGRTLAQLTRDVIRGIVALFVIFDRLSQTTNSRFTRSTHIRISSGPRLARRIAGRAPPALA